MGLFRQYHTAIRSSSVDRVALRPSGQQHLIDGYGCRKAASTSVAASVSQRPRNSRQRSPFNFSWVALHARNAGQHFQNVTDLIGRALALDEWHQLVKAVVDIMDITCQPSAMSKELFRLPLCRTNACDHLSLNDLPLSIGHGPVRLSDRYHHRYSRFTRVLNQIQRISHEFPLPAPAAEKPTRIIGRFG